MEIKARIGAAVDADMGAVVFQPLVRAAQRAAHQIRSEFDVNKLVSGGGGAPKAPGFDAIAKTIVAHRMNMDRQVLAAHLERQKIATQGEIAAARDSTRQRTQIELEQIRATARQRKAAIAEETRERVRASRVVYESPVERQVRSPISRAAGSAAKPLAHAVGDIVRRGVGLAGEVLQGAGVDFSIGSMVGKNVERDTLARQISNSAYIPASQGGEGAQTERRSSESIAGGARAVANEMRMDPTEVLQGLQEFTALTGKLDAAEGTMRDLAMLSKATGSNFAKMMQAGAQAYQVFDRTSLSANEKLAMTVKVMRAVAGGGKLGAVEVPVFATQFAKLGAASGRFAGDKDTAMTDLGAAMQISMGALGGSASPTQAATAVQALARDFPKKGTLRGLRAVGIKDEQLFADSSHQQLRALPDLMATLFRATGGDLKKLSTAMPNSMSMRAVQGFMTIGGEAEKKQKGTGEAAIRAEFDRFRKVVMGEGEIKESARQAIEGPEGQTREFQNKLEELVRTTGQSVIPALLKLADQAMPAANALADVAKWAAESPLHAGLAVGGAAVGKATLEKASELAAEKLLGFAAALGPVGILLAALGGVLLYTTKDNNTRSENFTGGGAEGAASDATDHEGIVHLEQDEAGLSGAGGASQGGMSKSSAVGVSRGVMGEDLTPGPSWLEQASQGAAGPSWLEQASQGAGGAGGGTAELQEQISELHGAMQDVKNQLASGIPVRVTDMPPMTVPATYSGAGRYGPGAG